MAFTIRSLSDEAELSIQQVLEKWDINTKSKAVEYILEEYQKINDLKSELNKAQNKCNELSIELETIRNAINILNSFSKKNT